MPIKNRHVVISVGAVTDESTTSPEVDLSSMDTALIYLSVDGSGTVNEVTVQTNADPFGTAGTWRDAGLAPLNVNVPGEMTSELVFPFPFFSSTDSLYGSPGNICPQRVRFVRTDGDNDITIHVEGIRQIA